MYIYIYIYILSLLFLIESLPGKASATNISILDPVLTTEQWSEMKYTSMVRTPEGIRLMI